MGISDWSSDVCSSDLIRVIGSDPWQKRFSRQTVRTWHDHRHGARAWGRATVGVRFGELPDDQTADPFARREPAGRYPDRMSVVSVMCVSVLFVLGVLLLFSTLFFFLFLFLFFF